MIDPENIINNYGADAVRLFILSDSPPEKDVQWSDQGISYLTNLFKNYGLHNKIKEEIKKDIKVDNKECKINKFTNKMVKKISSNLENFNYNVIIANIYEIIF